MFSKFARDGVIVGQLDSFCLVCGCYLRDEINTRLHIGKPVHKNNLETVGYFEKYKTDHIRKVKNGYFCEFCNLLLPTAAQTGLHIVEMSHKNNKGAFLLNRLENDVVAFDNVLIKEDAWHGLTEDTCLICNAEFEAKEIHKAEQKHVLKLIQIKVMFREKNVYRKIDDNTYQCLTCNCVFSSNSINEHFNSNDHYTTFKNSEIEFKNHCSTSTKDANDGTLIDKDMKPDNIKQEGTKVNTIEDVKPINISEKVNTNGDGKPAEMRRDNTKPVDILKTVEEIDMAALKALGSTNYLLDVENGAQFCVICYSSVVEKPPELHFQKRQHQALLSLHKERLKKKIQNRGRSERNNIVTQNHNDVDQNDAENKAKILDEVTSIQKEEINIDFINEVAFCKKCNTPIDFSYVTITKHIKEHKKASNNKDIKKQEYDVERVGKTKNLATKTGAIDRDETYTQSGDLTEDIIKIAKDNGITCKGGKLFCDECSVEVPQTLDGIYEHICSGAKSISTQTALVVVKRTPSIVLKKVTLQNFVQNVSLFEINAQSFIVINEKICLSWYSFLLIFNSLYEMNCLVCNDRIRPMMLNSHLMTEAHRQYYEEIEVVLTASDTEFIREIKQGLYHCGVCNQMTKQWEDMTAHLSTFFHISNKTAFESRLREYTTKRRAAPKDMQFAHLMSMLLYNDVAVCHPSDFHDSESDD